MSAVVEAVDDELLTVMELIGGAAVSELDSAIDRGGLAVLDDRSGVAARRAIHMNLEVEVHALVVGDILLREACRRHNVLGDGERAGHLDPDAAVVTERDVDRIAIPAGAQRLRGGMRLVAGVRLRGVEIARTAQARLAGLDVYLAVPNLIVVKLVVRALDAVVIRVVHEVSLRHLDGFPILSCGTSLVIGELVPETAAAAQVVLRCGLRARLVRIDRRVLLEVVERVLRGRLEARRGAARRGCAVGRGRARPVIRIEVHLRAVLGRVADALEVRIQITALVSELLNHDVVDVINDLHAIERADGERLVRVARNGSFAVLGLHVVMQQRDERRRDLNRYRVALKRRIRRFRNRNLDLVDVAEATAILVSVVALDRHVRHGVGTAVGIVLRGVRRVLIDNREVLLRIDLHVRAERIREGDIAIVGHVEAVVGIDLRRHADSTGLHVLGDLLKDLAQALCVGSRFVVAVLALRILCTLSQAIAVVCRGIRIVARHGMHEAVARLGVLIRRVIIRIGIFEDANRIDNRRILSGLQAARNAYRLARLTI